MSAAAQAADRAAAVPGDEICGCPVCDAPVADPLLDLQCGGIDGSSLYPVVRLMACRSCGHAYNMMTPDELAGLGRYYNDEYAPANLGAADLAGDRPGSSSTLTSQRYAQLWSALAPFVAPDHAVLDVGCALGGFLDTLRGHGLSNLAGVDMTKTYVAAARRRGDHRIELGNAESLPFDDASFDAVVIEQVLEHLVHPLRAFQEARRVLRPDGVLCIGVPDAARYKDLPFFDYYWLLLREHIQHFDARHLALLAARAGFELCDVRHTEHAVMSERMRMPNLCAIFRKRDHVGASPEPGMLTDGIAAYLNQEKTRAGQRRLFFAEQARTGRPLIAWGIGREFLWLHAAAGLAECNLVGLVDANPLKQKSWSVGGMPVGDPRATLAVAPADAMLLLTAIAHAAPIASAARAFGFDGAVQDFGVVASREAASA